MVTSLLLGPLPMQDFCDFCGRDGLVPGHASVHALRGLSVSHAHAAARTHLHVDQALSAQILSRSTEVIVVADLLDRARLKRGRVSFGFLRFRKHPERS